MNSLPPPLEIILKFISTKEVKAFTPFSWEETEYLLEHKDGHATPVRFSWNDPRIRRALESWEELEMGSQVMEGLVRCLQEFLSRSLWPVEEARIEQALNEKPPRPVHLVIQTQNADELNFLPWELLKLKSDKRFIGMEECLVQYECLPRKERDPLPPLSGRILLAYSHVGGRVPADGHIQAIQKACANAGFLFDPNQDVLHSVSSASLVEKLSEMDRPVTALHLLCHGTQVGDSYGLLFSSVGSPTEAEPIDARELQDLVFPSHRPSPLRLVTLCSCHGGDAGVPANLVGSMARMFHQQGVPAVIASRLPLTCDGSVTLTETLYEGLLEHRNLRTVLSDARSKLRSHKKGRDWLSLQLYARAGDKVALEPFVPLPAIQTSPDRRLILIRHEAYSRAATEPEHEDAPALFAGRKPQIIGIDQTPLLEQRDWKNLQEEVTRFAAQDGDLRRAYAERNADVAYYGFPYVPLAVLAGHLAKGREVYAFEYVSNRFKWEAGAGALPLPLEADAQLREVGTAARLRFSISAPVSMEDCRQVLPDSEVALDLHFFLEDPKRGRIRHEEQLKAYVQKIQDTLDQYILGNTQRSLQSVHVFAAVPVSLAFHIGRALSATWLPECFIYNYGRNESPAYKWRLSLQSAAQGKRSIKIFK